MVLLNESQLKKIASDIESIKDVLAKSRSSIQLLFLPVHFRSVFLLTGVSILIFSCIFSLLTKQYGTYSEIPGIYRSMMIGAIFLDGIFLGFLKNRNWVRSLSGINPEYNFRRAYIEFFSFRVIQNFFIVGFTMFVFILYWIYTGYPYFIIPTVGIGVGLLGNFLGSMTGIIEFTLMGLWTLICGFIIILIGTIPGPIAVSFSLGIGLLIFALYSYLRNSQQEG